MSQLYDNHGEGDSRQALLLLLLLLLSRFSRV